MQVEAGTGHPGSTWASMQSWNRGDQHPGGAESENSTGAEQCERQQRLLRCSSNKREAKDRVSSLLDRDGEEEMLKCTEKPEVLNAFFAPVFSGKISSQVSHTPEARKETLPESDKSGTKCTYKQGKICICDLQELTNFIPFWNFLLPRDSKKTNVTKPNLSLWENDVAIPPESNFQGSGGQEGM